MTSLTIIVLESVPASLRGELARWMIEIKAGVFVGRLSAMVRDKMWRKVIQRKKGGNAILVHASDNEQRFCIEMNEFHGRSVIDYDGLQLVRVDDRTGTMNKTNDVNDARAIHEGVLPILRKRLLLDDDDALPSKCQHDKLVNDDGIINQNVDASIGTDPVALPPGFVERSIVASMRDGHVMIDISATSNARNHPEEHAWHPEWMTDVTNACRSIMNAAIIPSVFLDEYLRGKRIACVDIETTNYLPKAFQGFVNIICIAVIDFHVDGYPTLHVHQVFNTTRNRDLVPFLVDRALQHIDDVDTVLVFNKNFDIKILQSLIDQHCIDRKIPGNIIDLMERFRNLEMLEKSLFQMTGFKRVQTQKGKYDEYYAVFKGNRSGDTGKLEPIGSYNMIDALTPLCYYLLVPVPRDDITP